MAPIVTRRSERIRRLSGAELGTDIDRNDTRTGTPRDRLDGNGPGSTGGRSQPVPVPACRLIKVPVRRPRHSENYTVSPHAAEVQTTFFAPGIWVTSQVKVPTTTVGLKRGRDGTCTLSDAAKVLEIEVDIAS